MGKEQLEVVLTLIAQLEEWRGLLLSNDIEISKVEFHTTDSEHFYYLSDGGTADGWFISPDQT